MANNLGTLFTNIANAIRTKNGLATTYYPNQMADAILTIPTGSTPTLQNKTKNYTPTETAQSETVTADSGYDGLGQVSVSVGAIPSNYVGSGVTRRDETDLSASGTTVTVPAGYYAEQETKSVTLNLQSKNVSPTESAQTVTADSGYDGLDEVSVGAISSTYVGSGITRNPTMTVSGATVTAPVGYYDTAQTKTVVSGSATPQSTISATGATLTTGTNTLTLSKSVSNTPNVSAGYVSSGTAGNSSVSLTATVDTRSSSDLTVSGATVTAPAGYYGSSASASVASGTAGTPTATKGSVSNHSVTVTPSVTNTTGYITGGTKNGTAVTVSASELVSGSETKTANGTYDVTNLASLVVDIPIVTYYTGTSTPSSSLGNNGDIYLKTT